MIRSSIAFGLIMLTSVNAYADDTRKLIDILDPFIMENGDIDVAKLKAALAEEQKKIAEKRPKQLSGTNIYLRDNFTDLGFFSEDRGNLAKSKGATLQFTKDYNADDDILNFKGTLFIATTKDGDYGSNYLGWSIIPYIGANIDRHSSKGEKDTETYIGGIAAEIGTDYGGFDQFYRFSAGGVRDVTANQTSMKLKAEFFPVLRHSSGSDFTCVGRPCTIPDINLLYVFQPELLAIYGNSFDNDSDPFSGGSDDLRLGGQLSLLLQPGFLQDTALSRLYGRVTYQWTEELLSGKAYDYLDLSAWYNFDEDGHLALSASYLVGNDEDNGEDVEKFKVGLTGKF